MNSNKVHIFLIILLLFSIVSCNFIHNKKIEIEHPYYVIAADDESQATISFFEQEYDSYIGITDEGIINYAILGDYVLGKRKTKQNSNIEYHVIFKGSKNCKTYNSFEEFLIFLKSVNLDSNKIEWKKI